MYTASVERDPTAYVVDNERTLSLFGVVLGVLGGGGVFVFWAIGRVLLHTGNGGQLVQLLGGGGPWTTAYNAYPFLMAGCFLLAAVLYWGLGRYKEAAGVAALPVAAAVAYYLALVALR